MFKQTKYNELEKLKDYFNSQILALQAQIDYLTMLLDMPEEESEDYEQF